MMQKQLRGGSHFKKFPVVIFSLLFLLPLTSFAQTFNRPLYIGSQGADVSALQTYLKAQGYFAYPTITGFYGSVTWKAVVAFQKANNLSQVGTVGPKTRALLNNSSTAQSSSGNSGSPVVNIPFVTTTNPPCNAPAGLTCIPGTSITQPASPGNGYTPGFGGGGGSLPDTVAPSVSFATPSNAATVGGSAVSLVASASDNVAVSSVQFKVDNADIGSAVTSSPYVASWDSTGVTDGAHTLYAVAADTSGNLATSSISVTVDNTAPVISSVATSTVNNANVTVTWSTNESANSKVVYGTTSGYSSQSSSATLSTSHSITLTGLTNTTVYHFAVVSADAAGNTSTSSDKIFTTQTGLLGVNMSGAEGAPWINQKFPNSADWAYLQSKGITFVRLPIAWESVQPTLNAALDSTYLGKIQTAIANAHTYGISVIVDLHNFGAYCNQAHWLSSGCGYAGNAGSTGTGVNFLGDGTLTQADFTDVWTRLSTALVGTPGLLGYDLMNEPSLKLLQYGTNLLFAPNGFADSVGLQPWYFSNAAVLTQQSVSIANPIAGYAPVWSVTSGSGFGFVNQDVSIPSTGKYTFSIYAKTTSGTDTLCFGLDFSFSCNNTVTTSWQRFSTTTISISGSHTFSFGPAADSSGHTYLVADGQLESGNSATTYKPNVWLPYAQAAINAIRGVDASTAIYVSGSNGGTAYLWPWENWDLATLTGGNLVFEAHNYFDGSVSQGGGGGNYSGNYSSYSITSTAGVQEVAPFESFLASTSVRGYLGEYAVPDNSKGDQTSWLTLQDSFLQSLIANNIPSTMWFYGNSENNSSNNLSVSTSTTLNAGSDDQRLLRMLLQY